MSWARSRSRSGWSAVSAISSETTSACLAQLQVQVHQRLEHAHPALDEPVALVLGVGPDGPGQRLARRTAPGAARRLSAAPPTSPARRAVSASWTPRSKRVRSSVLSFSRSA